MSLDKNLSEVKDKLAGDQSMLVNAFRLESFYKKYKFWIYIIIAAILGFGVYKGVSHYILQAHRAEVGVILNELASNDIEKNKKTELLNELKAKDSTMYDFYMYDYLRKLSVLQIKEEENLDILKGLMGSKEPLIAEFATYQYGSINEDLGILEAAEFKNTPILRDRARFLAAFLYLQKDEISKARTLLDSIQKRDDNEQIYQMASFLKHYGILK